MSTALTDRECQVLDALRADPLLDAAAVARRIGSTRAAVAVHISALMKKGFIAGRGYVLRSPGAVVVVGGANLDIKCRTSAPALAATSNPGAITSTPGGVARNIAANLARLGVPVRLFAAVGEDESGDRIMRETATAGVDLSLVLRLPRPTGLYTAVLGPEGDLVVAVSAMDIMAELTPERVRARAGALAQAALVVADANLPQDTLLALCETTAAEGVRLVLEPVSVPKAERLRPLLAARLPVFLVTPNRDELAALAGREVADDGALTEATATLHARGVAHVAVGLGQRGVLVSSADAPARPVIVPAAATAAVDVTGGGDAALAGMLWALLAGHDLATAARAGQAAAARAVASVDSDAALDAAALAAAIGTDGAEGRPAPSAHLAPDSGLAPASPLPAKPMDIR
ncbi:winged helix-turn-helix transcriptional regulator [Chelatococcus sp. SYSU_G07232]|uniref:Winged helix-turn-helix transcriptional regulator n=1 Tax=Chelatococcus albus TaxID=3047466 RepID=A0ABT7ADD4_9HYPH|nr:carbohydrate kinase [Chelatococcus sp. SYSU_G07232]MDJ1157369.1 winged helix-turn-helix transcriptional regulator [Chelatococcus sp. SYSU_G07232]